MAKIDPPYRLDPRERIVGVGWGGKGPFFVWSLADTSSPPQYELWTNYNAGKNAVAASPITLRELAGRITYGRLSDDRRLLIVDEPYGGGGAYTASYDVTCYKPRSGDVAWTTSLPGGVNMLCAFSFDREGNVLSLNNNDGNIKKFDGDTGAVLLDLPFVGARSSSDNQVPAAVMSSRKNEIVGASTTTYGGPTIVTKYSKDGVVLWSTTFSTADLLGGEDFVIWGGVAPNGDVFVCGDNVLSCLAGDTGSVKWRSLVAGQDPDTGRWASCNAADMDTAGCVWGCNFVSEDFVTDEVTGDLITTFTGEIWSYDKGGGERFRLSANYDPLCIGVSSDAVMMLGIWGNGNGASGLQASGWQSYPITKSKTGFFGAPAGIASPPGNITGQVTGTGHVGVDPVRVESQAPA